MSTTPISLSLSISLLLFFLFFFFNHPAPTEIYTLSLHDALPIYSGLTYVRFLFLLAIVMAPVLTRILEFVPSQLRSEEHTSELQSHHDLVCRLLLEKKKKKK